MLHIAREETWEAAKRSGSHGRPGGVVHGCFRSQLAMVVEAHVPSLTGWIVLTVDESRVDGGGRRVTHTDVDRAETFPHIHGTFPVSALSCVESLAAALTAR